jgi:hypothetical protein
MNPEEMTIAEAVAEGTLRGLLIRPAVRLEVPGAGFRLDVYTDESMMDESGLPWRNFRRYFAACICQPGFPPLTIRTEPEFNELARVVAAEAKRSGFQVKTETGS